MWLITKYLTCEYYFTTHTKKEKKEKRKKKKEDANIKMLPFTFKTI